jgi:methylenetetrahydrofolate reductase (NADPH)
LSPPAADLLRERLARREWAVTVEVVTPPPDDERARARILALAASLRDDERVAALTLTDRTTGAATVDVVRLGEIVAAASGAVPLVHVAGKGRTRDQLVSLLRRLDAAGLRSVLLTTGDTRDPGDGYDAVAMFGDAAATAPDFLLVGVTEPMPGRPLDEAYARALAKRTAARSASTAPPVALVAQVSWDLALREAIAEWQLPLETPILGAVMWLTRKRLEFLAEHAIGGIVAPPALRRRLNGEPPEAAQRRLALDLVLLRRLGYAGAHISGLLTPSRITAVLDEAERLDRTLSDDWRDVWREAAGIA